MTRNFTRACKIKTILNNGHKSAQEYKHIKKKIQQILSKHKSDRTSEEETILKQYKHITKLVESQKRYQILRKERELEVEDEDCLLKNKCSQLVDLIRKSKYTVVYTGAGISTSASIPDYRGPNGVWTQLKNGYNTPKVNDLVFAEPTFTHLAISELVRGGYIKHIVSQNCDGLHIRSGIPHQSISEIHGNMFIEVCKSCKKSYIRSFDVTEKTALRKHATGRKCHSCTPEEGILIDTIVHFGEKGKLNFPLNWDEASNSAQNADLIICLGSSLKILRKYYCLWPKNKKNLKLVVINLQWTPKDSQAAIKINAKCDTVMQEIMNILSISIKPYERLNDPILKSRIPLKPDEEDTCHRVKLEDLLIDKIDESKICLTPGWFGKGVRRK